MQEINNEQITFIGEQDGEIERTFKRELENVFFQSSDHIRAYLVRAQYNSNNEVHVILAIKSKYSGSESLLHECSRVFQSIFSSDVHLDMLYITDVQENNIRQLCCPFYTSENFRVATPDFYMFSTESNDIASIEPIACYKEKRLYGDHPDGYILCTIEPALIGQSYGLGGEDIDQVIITSRFQGTSLFPVNEWPAHIYVARPLVPNIHMRHEIHQGDSEVIAWAHIDRNK